MNHLVILYCEDTDEYSYHVVYAVSEWAVSTIGENLAEAISSYEGHHWQFHDSRMLQENR